MLNEGQAVVVTGRRRGIRLLLASVSVALFATFAATEAEALQTGLGDPVFKDGDPATRDYWFQQASRSGAGTIGIHVHWNQIVGGVRPADPTDPGDPEYDFSTIDRAVRGASSRGYDVFLTLFAAPLWAEPPGRWDGLVGSWKPRPRDFGQFAEAVAIRYSGRFQPLGETRALPRVRYYEAWNEPNLPYFLAPQGSSRSGLSAGIYRRLLSSFYDAVKSVSSGNKVIAGATAPYGRDASNKLRRRTRPVAFFRHLLCVNRKGKKTSCPNKAKFDILSHHGINTTGNPRVPALDRDDASTADLGKIRTLLRRAERNGTVFPRNARPRQLWVTEFWINSDPPSSRGPSPKIQARWVQDSLYLFSRQGVSRAVYFLLSDLPELVDSAAGAGLFFGRKKPKPSFNAFRTALNVRRVASGNRIAVWIKRPPAEPVELQARGRRGWTTVRSFPKGQATINASVRSTGSGTGRISQMRVVSRGSNTSGIPTRVR